jgi:anti-anti-sigma factor
MFEIEKNGVVSILRSDRPLNCESVESACESSAKCLSGARLRVVVDFSHIPLLDSQGLEWLLNTHEKCASTGGRMVIAAASPLCRDIIAVTRVADCCEIYNDLLSAIGSLSR